MSPPSRHQASLTCSIKLLHQYTCFQTASKGEAATEHYGEGHGCHGNLFNGVGKECIGLLTNNQEIASLLEEKKAEMPLLNFSA